MIPALIVAAAALAALAWVLAPTRRPEASPVGEVDERRDALLAEKRAGLAAIVELEEDLAGGKLTTPDFEALRRTYEDKVLVALEALESEAAHPTTPDEQIEAEVAAARARLSCARCGALRPTGEACPRCGSAG